VQTKTSHTKTVPQISIVSNFHPHFFADKTPLITVNFILVQIKYDDNLWAYLKNNSNVALKERLQILLRIWEAVDQLQNKKLVHLDVKLSNVLINYDSNIIKKILSMKKWNSADRNNLVLADFGLSGDIATCSKNAGTPGVASPEQMIGKVHRKSDLYSLGKLSIMILFEWDTAWALIAQPKTKAELKDEKIHGTEMQKCIASLLQVKNA
jgi:serine/threonine protein kinase